MQTKGLLGLSHSKAVGTDYHAGNDQLRKEQPQDIIAAMYDLGDPELLEQTLLSLYQQGWLEFEQDNSSFRTSPVIQAVVREQNKECLAVHIEDLIKQLIAKLEYEPSIGHIIHISYDTVSLYCDTVKPSLLLSMPAQAIMLYY